MLFALTRRMPSLAVNLGKRTRSMLDWSNTVVVLRMPSVMLLARSKMPTAGFVKAPTRPLPTPLKKPAAPPASAPSSGFVYAFGGSQCVTQFELERPCTTHSKSFDT